MIDNLSRSLQAKHMSACEGQKLVQVTLSALQSIRSDEQFSLFWQYVDVRRSRLDGAISSPVLTRHKKVPRQREIGESVSEQSTSTAQDHYRMIYFQVIDTAMGTIKDRFDQRGFLMLQKLEALLISRSVMDRSTLSEIISAYGSDFKSADALETQLLLLQSAINGDLLTNLQSIVDYLKSLTLEQRGYFCEVTKLVKLILVMPATNATSKRCFIALRRLKTWLRATTVQQRINWCMLLHVHKDRTDQLKLPDIVKEFVSQNTSRMNMFV